MVLTYFKHLEIYKFIIHRFVQNVTWDQGRILFHTFK